MMCERLLRLLSRRQGLVPIWSTRVQDRLVPLLCMSSAGLRLLSGAADSHMSATVEMQDGLPRVTVPLPSRQEPCVFTLRPVTHTVGDLLAMLRHEDAGIDRAVVRTPLGVRVAATTSIQTLFGGEFQLVINDTPYRVTPPPEAMALQAGGEEEQRRLGSVRALVGQLYEALNVEEHQALQEQRLMEEMEALREELAPLERQREELQRLAEKRTNNLTWLGLGMMSVQFGILARLTWWEYSWDIMEPVTYFVTYGTAVACYAYFVMTKQDYLLPDVRDRQFLFSFHRRAKRSLWDVHKYNALKDGVASVERDLRRLRDPLRLRLQPKDVVTKKENAVGGGLSSISFKNILKGKLS